MSLFSSPRCILILGDEGLQIYNVGRFGAKFIDSIPWETDDFEVSVSGKITKECRRNPIIILNDMVEQHYRKENIPKVSILDRANVLRRRLGITFPNYRIRAALKLKDKGSDLNKGGSTYLFAAIPSSDHFTKTINAVRISAAPIIGLYLLPIEAASMVRELSDKLTKGQRYKPKWTIFVGQHNNGGLRQVVTRGGELALTRMTPIVDTDVEPELWAKELSGELNATMSYLARFGYKETDGLNVIIIANESSQASLEALVDIECDLKVIDAGSAARMVGVNAGQQEDYRYADPLHAAYLGKRKTFQLPMQAQAIKELTQPRRVASFIMMGLMAACLYYGFTAFQGWKKSFDINDQLVVAIQQNRSLKQEYEREIEKKKALGFDFRLVNNSIAIFNEFEKKKMQPLPVIREIGRSLGPDIHLDNFVVQLKKVAAETDPNNFDFVPEDEKEFDYFLEGIMSLSFPNTINPDLGVERVNRLESRLRENLPDYSVEILKQVAGASYTGNFEAVSGEKEDGDVPERYDAEIKVRRLIK